jgi:hypothetical protein
MYSQPKEPSQKDFRFQTITVVISSIIALSGLILIVRNVAPSRQSVYWGAWINGDHYGLEDAPWSREALDLFESHAGKKMSILHWGQSWQRCRQTCAYQDFEDQIRYYDSVRSQGYIPLIDWASWDPTIVPQYNQPQVSLASIINGEHDAYIYRWATQAKSWGKPFFLRFNWEMNGDWFPWSEKRNGNSQGQFVAAWRHVHDIFTEVGAHNVTWVWCPNALHPKGIPLDRLYPGDAYVDWTCIDGYNWGTHPSKPDRWKSFNETFKETYDALLYMAPGKPIMIAEVASSEVGGSKANWITDALTAQLPDTFPGVKALVWFNWNVEGMDWSIESSDEAQQAFASGIASGYFAANEFQNIDVSPIPPLERLQLTDNAIQSAELGR